MSWTRCTLGHDHFGRYGAAGLLLHEGGNVLLQHRSPHVHHGGTWAIPGGARWRGEKVTMTALREALEETGLDPMLVNIETVIESACGGWVYSTVIAAPTGPLHLSTNWESTATRWVELDSVSALPLHPGFRATWDHTLHHYLSNQSGRQAKDTL